MASWKGFVKAFERLPQAVLSKTGYAKETVDQEFNALAAQTTQLDSLAVKILADARKLQESLSQISSSLITFASIVTEVTELNDYSLSNCSLNIQAKIKSNIDTLNTSVILPLEAFTACLDNVKLKIKKRGNKLLDYDRFRNAVQSLSAKTDRSLSDEKKLSQNEIQLANSTEEYNTLNNTLLDQLPQLLALRFALLDPILKSLFVIQNNFFKAYSSELEHLVLKYGTDNARQVHDENVALVDQMISSLTIVRRPSRTSKTSCTGLSASAEQVSDSKSPNSLPKYSAINSDSPPVFSAMHSAVNRSPSLKQKTVVALYDFKGERDDDLTFKEKDVIVVTDSGTGDGWMKGHLQSNPGFIGNFPGNYCS